MLYLGLTGKSADRSGAQERTRTFTSLRILAPEASASTNFTTWAGKSNYGRDWVMKSLSDWVNGVTEVIGSEVDIGLFNPVASQKVIWRRAINADFFTRNGVNQREACCMKLQWVHVQRLGSINDVTKNRMPN